MEAQPTVTLLRYTSIFFFFKFLIVLFRLSLDSRVDGSAVPLSGDASQYHSEIVKLAAQC